MANRDSADYKVEIYKADDGSAGSAPRKTSYPVHIGDICSELLSPLSGTGVGIQYDLNPNAPNSWVKQVNFSTLPYGLDFVSLNNDGSVTYGPPFKGNDESGGRGSFAGFIIRARQTWLDAKISGSSLTFSNTALNFTAIAGNWDTVPVRTGNPHTRVYYRGGATTGKAKTLGVIPANRQFCFDLVSGGVTQTTQVPPSARLIWGTYCLLFQQGAPVTLQQQVPGGSGSSGWANLRTLPGPNFTFADGRPHLGRIMRYAGRLCIEWAGQMSWWALPDPAQSAADAKQNGQQYKEVSWSETAIQFEATGCRVGFGIGVIKYAAPAGTLYTGGYGRRIKRYAPVPTADGAFIQPAGWIGAGTVVTCTATLASDSAGYDVVLTANADGIDTPLLSKVLMKQDAQWEYPTGEAVDFANACVGQIRVTSEIPGPQRPNSRSTASVEISDTLAAKLFSGTPNEKQLAWRTYADCFHRIRISTRWKNSDGTADPSDYVAIFDGYILDYDEGTSGFRGYTRTLICTDALCLLTAPAAVVLEDSAPLDDEFYSIVGNAFGYSGGVPTGDKSFYGRDAIKALVRRRLGPTAADGVQTYFAADHYPLLSASQDRCGYLPLVGALTGNLPFEQGFLFPAPYLKDYLSWMQQFCGYDQACLWIYWPTSDHSGSPQVLYGRIIEFLKSPDRQTHTFPDANYETGDVNKLILAIRANTRSERNYNEVAAYSSPPGTNLGGALPALRMARASIPASARYSARNTWPRTLVIENELGWMGAPGVAGVDALAILVRNELAGIEFIWPTVTTRAMPSVSPGDKAVLDLHNPFSPILGVNGFDEQTMRIQRVEHTINCEDRSDFTTTLGLRPLIASEV